MGEPPAKKGGGRIGQREKVTRGVSAAEASVNPTASFGAGKTLQSFPELGQGAGPSYLHTGHSLAMGHLLGGAYFE